MKKILILAIVSVFTCVCSTACTTDETTSSEEAYNVVVPDFTNEHIDDVMEKYGDTFNITTYYYSEEGYEKGIIFEQNRAVGMEIKKGEDICLFVSDGGEIPSDTTTTTTVATTTIATSTEPEVIAYPLVYEDNNVMIEYCGVENQNYSECVAFYVTNKNDFEITIQCSSISLDGLQIDGSPTMSDDVAPQSKAKVYAKYDSIENEAPTSISGVLRVIDFSREHFDSYDATFVNVEIK